MGDMPLPAPGETDPVLWRALHPALVDHVTAEVATAFRRAGMRSILLKGPVTAEALYDDPRDRLYADADLLVDPAQMNDARSVLEHLGFTSVGIEVSRYEPRPYAETWSREKPPVMVDLHNSVSGIGAPSEAVWKALTAETERMQIEGVDIEILSPGGRALVLALHAAHHGVVAQGVLDDLQRALDRLPVEAWHQAAAFAKHLDATAAFAAGLRLVEAGSALLERLAISSARSLDAELRAASAPHMSLVLTWLARGGATPRQKRAVVARRLFPPAEFIRAVYPFANRGRLGLAAGYVARPIALFARLPRALSALWRARRAVSRDD